MRRVLRNRAYLGEHHAGGAGHDPITTPGLFAAAQTEPQARRSNGAYPLSGVAVATMAPRWSARCRPSAVSATAGCVRPTGSARSAPTSSNATSVDRVAEQLGDARFRKLIEPVGKDAAEAALATAEASLLAHIDKVPPTSAGLRAGRAKVGGDDRAGPRGAA